MPKRKLEPMEEEGEYKKLGHLNITIYKYDQELDDELCMPRDLAKIQALIGEWINEAYRGRMRTFEVFALPTINYPC
jgi:hypothetical protein